MKKTATITLNGIEKRIPSGTTLDKLAGQHVSKRRRIAVMLNANVIPSGQWNKLRLCEGDRIEIVSLAGGG